MSFKVGFGKECIDWPIDEYPAQTFSSVCERKYDECNVRAIALDNGSKSVLMAVFELSDLPEVEDFEEKISKATGVPADDVIIIITHNHTSPCDRGARMGATEEQRAAFRERYLKIEEAAGIKACVSAVSNMQEARYGFGTISSDICENEITKYPVIGYYNDKSGNGFIDDTLSIIRFDDLDGNPIGFFMNHPSHATMAMGPDIDGKFTTSGNFTGITCRFLEDYYPGTTAIWTPGASGNLHPKFQFEMTPKVYTDGYSNRVVPPNGTEHVLMEVLGRNHAIDAINCINNIKTSEGSCELKHIKDSVMIPTQVFEKNERPPFDMNQPDYGPGVRSNQPKPRIIEKREPLPVNPDKQSKLQMELLQIGNITYICLGCEMFCQIGMDIKKALGTDHTVVITHVPGYIGDNPHQIGYVVDRSSVESQNHKLFRNLIPGGYDEIILNEAVKLAEMAK